MGFWNALSALAPIAPAMSDAADLRTAREQQQQDFASDQALKQAQLTTQKLADQAEQQRITQAGQPVMIGEPQWNPTTHSNQILTFDKNTGGLALKDVPGVDPSTVAAAKYAAFQKEHKSVTGRDFTPEEDDSAFLQTYGYKPTAAKVTALTGAAGQPQEYPKGSGNYVVFGRNADGNIVAQPVPAGYTSPAPKSLPPATQYMQLYTKKLLADRKQGPPLTTEETAQMQASLSTMDEPGIARMQALGKAYAQYHITPITDDSGAAVDVPIAAVLAANKAGTPPRTAAAGTADTADKKNAMLANSAIQQVNRMESILNRDPNLTGPGAGQLTQLQVWMGNQDPDAQAFLMSSLLGSEHGVAVFGGRNIHTIQDLQNTLGSWRTNPAALRAALGVIRETMTPWLTAGGRLPGPRTAEAGPAAPKGTVTLKAGGKTYNIPRDQVAAFRKDHPDASQ